MKTENCPYCNALCEADWVDVGVGYVQCGPYHCQAFTCGASEIGPCDDERELTAEEKKIGWYKPQSLPGSSANVVGGQIVTADVALAVYKRNHPFSTTKYGREFLRTHGEV